MLKEEVLEGSPASAQFSLQEIEFFQTEGYTIVRGLASESLRQRMFDVTRDNVERRVEPLELESDLQYPGAPHSSQSEGGRTIRRLKQALSRNIVFTEWLQHQPLLTRIRQLLGPQVVCPLAHHNCIMTKEPQFSSDTGWHQDLRYWSFTRPDLVNVWLALGPERRENGCLQVIPGTHRMSFPPESFDAAKFFRNDWPANEPILAQRLMVELDPGDVLFFHARTLHAATRNNSSLTKYSAVFTFRAIDNPPIEGTRSWHSPELLLH